MMASRIVSRLLPVAEGDSMFDGSRLDPDMDLESQRRADNGRDYQFDDDDPEAMFYEPPAASTPFRDNALSPDSRPLVHGSMSIAPNQPTWFDGQHRRRKEEEEEEDVPESLLLERKGKPIPKQPSVLLEQESGRARTEEQWNKMQQQHKLHSSNVLRLGRNTPAKPGSERATAPPLRSSPQANAMWTFTNASSLDAFLHEAYQYFTGHGMSSILLAKFLTQATENLGIRPTVIICTSHYIVNNAYIILYCCLCSPSARTFS
jgi:autophagy-related protein 9